MQVVLMIVIIVLVVLMMIAIIVLVVLMMIVVKLMLLEFSGGGHQLRALASLHLQRRFVPSYALGSGKSGTEVCQPVSIMGIYSHIIPL